jgi:hypothetical protein
VQTNNLIKSITPTQIISSSNGFLRLTNSSGVYIGDSMLTLKKLIPTPIENEFVGNRTVNYINGLIAVTNFTGVYVGNTLETLRKL